MFGLTEFICRFFIFVKILTRLIMVRIAIFASGGGSNAENISLYFRHHARITVSLILTNRSDAYVLERARKLGVPSVVFNRSQFYSTDDILHVLTDHRIDLIVLAGFLWLVPDNILRAYTGRIVNIHPALLPKYGGKGMYGDRVHQAVMQSGDSLTGITIHLVNERYDEGQILFQDTCRVTPDDTVDTIAQKVHKLEYAYFPVEIEKLALKILNGGL